MTEPTNVNVDMTAVIQFIQTFGLPTALLLLIVLATWRMGSWIASNVMLPLTMRTVTFLDRIEAAVQHQSETLVSISTAVQPLKDAIETQDESVRDIRTLLDMQKNSIQLKADILADVRYLREQVGVIEKLHEHNERRRKEGEGP